MRGFFTRKIPEFDRVLLVESGSRHLVESLLPFIYSSHPVSRFDLFSCYAGTPEGFMRDRGAVYNVNDYSGRPAQRKLLSDLTKNSYDVLGIVCSAEPILATWKFVIAARIPAKVFVLNENGDIFWVDRGHLEAIRNFIAFRAGLTGSGAVRTVARVTMFPFTLLYLLLYAATVHLRRKLRTL